jgi:hypothetical protein
MDIITSIYIYFVVAGIFLISGIFLLIKNIRPIIGFILILFAMVMVICIFLYPESPIYIYRSVLCKEPPNLKVWRMFND